VREIVRRVVFCGADVDVEVHFDVACGEERVG
jgi:hypothetical protein